MATRKAKAKRYCTQRHVEFNGIGSSNWNLVDVPRALSEVNHRLYRQSRVYRCKVSSLQSMNKNNPLYYVYVLRDTWMLQKAYQMAKDAFDKNMTEEMADVSPKNLARWQDFRIVLDPKSSGVTTLSPSIRANGTLNTGTLSNGEFASSKVYKEDGTAMTFGLYGTTVRWSIVEEYDKTADVELTPGNSVSGADINPYGALDDDNQQAARDDLQTDGNSPPYDPNSLDGSKLFRLAGVIGATGDSTGSVGGGTTQKLTTGFIDAPLGLILIVKVDRSEEDMAHLELEVQAGDYKGVHGASYIDVNKKFSHRRG